MDWFIDAKVIRMIKRTISNIYGRTRANMNWSLRWRNVVFHIPAGGSSSSSGLEDWQIALIVIFVIILIAVIVIIVVCIVLKKKSAGKLKTGCRLLFCSIQQAVYHHSNS